MNEQNRNQNQQAPQRTVQPQPTKEQMLQATKADDDRHIKLGNLHEVHRLFDLEGNASELLKGLAKFRTQIKQPTLDASNPFFKSSYLTLTGLITAIDKGIEGTGLSYNQIIADNGPAAAVQTIITHEGGGILITKPFTLRPTKADPQGIGSATTYARRYQLQALFGIAGEKDDDGNAASNPQQRNQQYNRNNQQFNNRQNYNQYNGGNY